MHLDRTILNVLFVALALVFAALGALQCFWPEKHRALRDKLPRGYNPDSPLGRMMDRARGKESGIASGISGLILFCMIVFILGWWFLGHPTVGR